MKKQFFDKKTYDGKSFDKYEHEEIMVPSKKYGTTYYFELYLTHQQIPNSWKNLFHKGIENGDRTLATWICPSINKLHCRISTKNNANDGFDSFTVFDINKLYKLAFVVSKNHYSLYVNGMLDTTVRINSDLLLTDGPL